MSSETPKRISLSNGLVLSYVDKDNAQDIADSFRADGIQQVRIETLAGGLIRVSGMSSNTTKKPRTRRGPIANLLPITCVVCSKKFQPPQLNTKLCSAECKAARHKFHVHRNNQKLKVKKEQI